MFSFFSKGGSSIRNITIRTFTSRSETEFSFERTFIRWFFRIFHTISIFDFFTTEINFLRTGPIKIYSEFKRETFLFDLDSNIYFRGFIDFKNCTRDPLLVTFIEHINLHSFESSINDNLRHVFNSFKCKRFSRWISRSWFRWDTISGFSIILN